MSVNRCSPTGKALLQDPTGGTMSHLKQAVNETKCAASGRTELRHSAAAPVLGAPAEDQLPISPCSVSAQVNPVSPSAAERRDHRHGRGPAVPRRRQVPQRRHHRLLSQVSSRSSGRAASQRGREPAVNVPCCSCAPTRRYLLHKAPAAMAERTHIFSSFFYKQLTRRDNASEGNTKDS